MAYLCTFRCVSIEFDVFDSNRINPDTVKSKYFLTPVLLAKIEEWLILNNKSKISTKQDMDYLIYNNYFGVNA